MALLYYVTTLDTFQTAFSHGVEATVCIILLTVFAELAFKAGLSYPFSYSHYIRMPWKYLSGQHSMDFFICISTAVSQNS